MRINNQCNQNDLFLKSDGKGFCLQRLRKNDIAIHIKPKAKSNHIKPLNPIGGETLPELREETISSILQVDVT